MNRTPIENQSELKIGIVEFIAPNEIKVQLDIESPDGIAANAGIPRPFPRINSYVLIPNEAGYVVCQIEWITIERSPFPKRKGYQDYGLVDLPFPIRKMKVAPLGILKVSADNKYDFQRGVHSFPSIGSPVLIPTDMQLKSIIESGKNRRVYIGNSPIAANAEVKIDPDRLFGRHLAVLGNTGSGKSCTVAGLIQWSIEAAKKELNDGDRDINARFVVLDPNGEYAKVFGDKAKVLTVGGEGENGLVVPLWLWNSAELGAFTQASPKAQLPLLKRALREIRIGGDLRSISDVMDLRRKISSILISLRAQTRGGDNYEGWKFGPKLVAYKDDIEEFARSYSGYSRDLGEIYKLISDTINYEGQTYTKRDDTIGYNDFPVTRIEPIERAINDFLNTLGGIVYHGNFDEDTPIPYPANEFASHIDNLARQENNPQFFEFLVARIRTMLSDSNMDLIIGDKIKITLDEWLGKYLGENAEISITIIDLSLVPSEIIHISTSVISRIIFEALQRYRKLNKKSLPTVLVMEEAHSFITRYNEGSDINASAICTKVFEKIAREGRKFGLSLVLSSQRPSELSPTVLSQCNSFILHRISNDRDQELVGRLLPDNFRGLLKELPSLPSQQAALLGWASELPILVKIRDLPKEQRPQSEDPDFWNVWRRRDEHGEEVKREIDWKRISGDWQEKSTGG